MLNIELVRRKKKVFIHFLWTQLEKNDGVIPEVSLRHSAFWFGVQYIDYMKHF